MYMSDLPSPQEYLILVDRLVARNPGEIFILSRSPAPGKYYSRRWPWPDTGPSGCHHIDIGLFKEQPEEPWPRRTGVSITGHWCLMLDDVGTDKVTRVPEAEPTWKIETRPGNEQWVYVYDTPLRDHVRMRQILDGIKAAGMTDPGAASLTRLFRLPGSQPPGKPTAARLIEYTGWLYDADYIHEELGFDLPAPRVAYKHDPLDLESALRNPALQWLATHRQLLDGPNQDGWFVVPCPFGSEHGPEDPQGVAGYRPASRTSKPAFHCFHAHSGAPGGSREVGMSDFVAWMAARGGPDPRRRHLDLPGVGG
jgi:hypothetical protein